MRSIYFTLILLLVLLTGSCATLDITSLRDSERIPFEPLELHPHIETTELRIDLVRQTEEYQVNDTTKENRDTPYHPLGFDLGNGLFYDLSGNLSFRLDELLGITNRDCYSVKEISRRNQKKADRIYSFCDNELSVSYPPGRRQHELNHLVFNGKTTSVMYRSRFLYAVDFNDRTTVYRGKKRKWDTLHKSGENHYYRRKGWWRENFVLEGNRLDLNRDYILERTDKNRKIRILKPALFATRTVLTIEKNADNLYIYDRGYSGKKIEFTGSGLIVFRNRIFESGWTLLD